MYSERGTGPVLGKEEPRGRSFVDNRHQMPPMSDFARSQIDLHQVGQYDNRRLSYADPQSFSSFSRVCLCTVFVCIR